MRLEVFGCDGGIGDPLRTLALLVDEDILVEAGSGLGELPREVLARIDHVFVSHSHMDHIACLPLLADAVESLRDSPITVYGHPETLAALREHVFNWKIWPDFTRMPSSDRPLLRFSPLEVMQTVELGTRRVTALPAQHVVPTVGYLLDSGRSRLAYSADTTSCDALWQALNAVENLAYLIIETSFENARLHMTGRAGHLCPSLLEQELAKLEAPAEILVAHMKPGAHETIVRELGRGTRPVRALRRGDVLEF
jgi:ribonuclease BN (tRNA processing enzyme)